MKSRISLLPGFGSKSGSSGIFADRRNRFLFLVVGLYLIHVVPADICIVPDGAKGYFFCCKTKITSSAVESIPMALRKHGKWWYGDSQEDIRPEIIRYSKKAGYCAQHFADAVCKCGGKVFGLLLDDAAGVACRVCVACDAGAQPMADSAEFMEDAEAEGCACLCGEEAFEITIGVSLYDDSEDVRWLYVGCRCPKCGLTAVYGDWKDEFIGYRELLAQV